MRHRLTLATWLTVVWLGLWGDLTWANLLSGALIAGGVVAFWAPREPLGLHIRPIPLVRFFTFFAVHLVSASLQVAWEVVRPKSRPREAVIAVPIISSTRGVVAVIAATISLTPGTLVIDTVRLGPRTVLYVHVFDLHDRDELLADMARLEQLTRAALSPTRHESPPLAPEGHP